jgi:hypothetical protein
VVDHRGGRLPRCGRRTSMVTRPRRRSSPGSGTAPGSS